VGHGSDPSLPSIPSDLSAGVLASSAIGFTIIQ